MKKPYRPPPPSHKRLSRYTVRTRGFFHLIRELTYRNSPWQKYKMVGYHPMVYSKLHRVRPSRQGAAS